MALRDRMRERTQPFLDEGERIVTVIPGMSGAHPMLAGMLGLVGQMLMKPRVVVLTDRRMAVFRGGRWSLGPKELLAQGPPVLLGEPKGLFATVDLGERVYVHKRFHKDIEEANAAIRAAEPGTPPAVGQA